jgi:hypothetical protein
MHSKVFLWVFTSILIALLLYQTFVSMKAFASKPTFSNSEFLDQKDANLPDTTFCVPSENFVSYVFGISLVISKFWNMTKFERLF